MVAEKRFVSSRTERQPEVQPGSPVYVHCTRQSVEPKTGAVLLQVRLVNCAQQKVQTVILTAEGLSEYGMVLYTLRDLVLPDCDAAAHSVFGEKKIFALERTPVHRVRITVESVVFADGITWRKSSKEQLMKAEDAGYITCSCAMRNPKGMRACLLCGKALDTVEQPETEEPMEPMTEQLPSEPAIAYPEQPRNSLQNRPVTVQNFYYPAQPTPVQPHPAVALAEPPEEPEEEEVDTPSWLVVLLCILGVVALLASLGFLSYSLMQYFGKI